MSNPKIEFLLFQMKMMAKATLDAAAKVPEERRLHQLAEGKAHPLWTLGHLAWALDVVDGGLVLGRKPTLPREWTALFGPSAIGGAPVTTEPTQYPAWDEIVSRYQAAADATIAAVAELNDDELDGPVKGNPPEAFREMFRTMGVSLAGMVSHDAHHRGQMALLGAN